MVFESILLEQEQKELIAKLVEAARNVPRDQRRKFMFVQFARGSSLKHPGLAEGKESNVYKGDIEALARAGLLALSHSSRGTLLFDVTSLGFQYYEKMKRRLGEPVQRVEANMTEYLNTERFQRKYPQAHQKWSEAETLLWSSDSQERLTTIGHLCREALQEFAAALVEQHQPPSVDQDKAHTVARIKAVLDLKGEQLGNTEKPFLDALLAYWGTVSDLVQRQEHGGQKEGEPLAWIDGRRVVFQTVVLMFEIDSSLSWSR